MIPNRGWNAALARLDDLERKVAELATRVTALEEESEPPGSQQSRARCLRGGREWRG